MLALLVLLGKKPSIFQTTAKCGALCRSCVCVCVRVPAWVCVCVCVWGCVWMGGREVKGATSHFRSLPLESAGGAGAFQFKWCRLDGMAGSFGVVWSCHMDGIVSYGLKFDKSNNSRPQVLPKHIAPRYFPTLLKFVMQGDHIITGEEHVPGLHQMFSGVP